MRVRLSPRASQFHRQVAEVILFVRTVGPLAIAALLLACSDPDKADLSPFFLWGMRPGMHIDSVEQFLIRQDNMPWAKCEGTPNSVRRCERYTTWIAGRIEAVAGPDGRVLVDDLRRPDLHGNESRLPGADPIARLARSPELRGHDRADLVAAITM